MNYAELNLFGVYVAPISVMMVTALSPVIGYDQASVIAHYAIEHDLTLKDAALANGVSEELFDRVVKPMEQVRKDRPYFEVLIVEDMTEQQERALLEEMRRWRRPDDPFTYEIVVLHSLEDALMAARLNFRLQACVVRRRFTHRSRYDSSSLHQFADLIVAPDLMVLGSGQQQLGG